MEIKLELITGDVNQIDDLDFLIMGHKNHLRDRILKETDSKFYVLEDDCKLMWDFIKAFCKQQDDNNTMWFSSPQYKQFMKYPVTFDVSRRVGSPVLMGEAIACLNNRSVRVACRRHSGDYLNKQANNFSFIKSKFLNP